MEYSSPVYAFWSPFTLGILSGFLAVYERFHSFLASRHPGDRDPALSSGAVIRRPGVGAYLLVATWERPGPPALCWSSTGIKGKASG